MNEVRIPSDNAFSLYVLKVLLITSRFLQGIMYILINHTSSIYLFTNKWTAVVFPRNFFKSLYSASCDVLKAFFSHKRCYLLCTSFDFLAERLTFKKVFDPDQQNITIRSQTHLSMLQMKHFWLTVDVAQTFLLQFFTITLCKIRMIL